MKLRMKVRVGAAALGCAICFVLFCAWSTDGPALAVCDFETGESLVEVPVDYGRTFTMRYIHSVDLSPVYEVFRIERGDGLVLEETYFRKFGAGMGHWPGHGRLVSDGEWTRIEDIGRVLGGFVLRIGSRDVAHTLIVGEREINLSAVAPGRRVKVVVTD